MNTNEQTPIEPTPSPGKKHRRNGLLIFALIFAAMFAISYRPSLDAVYCDANTLLDKPDVIMLGTSWCPYCYQARKYFVQNNIRYCEYNIEDNSHGAQFYAELNRGVNSPGMQPLGIPILLIGEYQFSGFEQSRIEKALSTTRP